MTRSLADAIRVKLSHIDGSKRADALLAVVDKCEQMRMDGGSPLQVADNHRVADEFESAIARALGITEEN